MDLSCSIIFSVISLKKMEQETLFHTHKKSNWIKLILESDLLIIPHCFVLFFLFDFFCKSYRRKVLYKKCLLFFTKHNANIWWQEFSKTREFCEKMSRTEKQWFRPRLSTYKENILCLYVLSHEAKILWLTPLQYYNCFWIRYVTIKVFYVCTCISGT